MVKKPKVKKVADYQKEGDYRWNLGDLVFDKKEKGYSKKNKKTTSLD